MNEASAHKRCSSLCGPVKRLIFLGAPGAGKGTHSEWMKDEFKLLHLSTGDMLREQVALGSALGKQAKVLMDAGQLVSDDIVLGMIREKVFSDEAKNGFILDGFPRNISQAEAFDKILLEGSMTINGVVLFDTPDHLLVKRVTGRRIHAPSGRSYNIFFKPPKIEGKDDVTGEDLIHRRDDTEETMNRRLAVYHEETAPLLEYYRRKNLLFRVESVDIGICKSTLKSMLACPGSS